MAFDKYRGQRQGKTRGKIIARKRPAQPSRKARRVWKNVREVIFWFRGRLRGLIHRGIWGSNNVQWDWRIYNRLNWSYGGFSAQQHECLWRLFRCDNGKFFKLALRLQLYFRRKSFWTPQEKPPFGDGKHLRCLENQLLIGSPYWNKKAHPSLGTNCLRKELHHAKLRIRKR